MKSPFYAAFSMLVRKTFLRAQKVCELAKISRDFMKSFMKARLEESLQLQKTSAE